MQEQASETPVRRLEELGERGAFLETADLAKRLLRQYAIDSLELDAAPAGYDLAALTYHHVWAVARSGATARALQLFSEYRLGERRDYKTEGLYARILKDRALKTMPAERPEALSRAAQAYQVVHDHHGGHWPAVNAATLHLLAGSEDTARHWAAVAVEECMRETAGTDLDGYFRSASMAEASLVLGDVETATRELWRAGTYDAVGHATRATTRKQLRLVCQANRLDPDILSLIDVPMVIYYAGHIISPPGAAGRFPADQEGRVADQIGQLFDDRKAGFAFGSLAAGADILIAEACRERGIDLHVVLPFDDDEFIETSVRPAGEGWVERFHACLDWCREGETRGVASVNHTTEGSFLGDESLFLYGAQFAMGMAVLRARNLDTEARMFAVFDGVRGKGVGTDGNIALWTGIGLECDIVDLKDGTKSRPAARAPVTDAEFPTRHPRAILYGDVDGYSELKEEDLARFNNTIMAAISRVLDRYGEHVLYRNSFGDAVYLVFDGAVAAAQCGLAIQKVFDEAEFRRSETGAKLSFRLGGHFGPLFYGTDFIRNEPSFFGSHVTKVARVEPITPPGAVYVTEPMAAALALSGADDIECDYVGVVALAKDYGEFRMYVLRERR